ncbi:MAG: hypothetical protein U1F45_17610 [Burkholderiales bacterium]
MRRIDAFNGDADGICALHQLRLAEPADSVLVTGPKRDIALLPRVAARAGDEVTVLDVSLDRNRGALEALLERGVRVRWFDHHYPGEIPSHPLFEPHRDRARRVHEHPRRPPRRRSPPRLGGGRGVRRQPRAGGRGARRAARARRLAASTACATWARPERGVRRDRGPTW